MKFKSLLLRQVGASIMLLAPTFLRIKARAFRKREQKSLEPSWFQAFYSTPIEDICLGNQTAFVVSKDFWGGLSRKRTASKTRHTKLNI